MENTTKTNVREKVAYQTPEGIILAIRKTDEGNEYFYLKKDCTLIEQGSHDDPEWTVEDLARDLLAEGDVPPFADLSKFEEVDFDMVMAISLI